MPTTRKVLSTLHSVLEHAITQDWIATNAARGTKVIGPRSEGSKKVEPPSKEDMRKLVEAAPEGLRLMLIFAASTGVRAGEQWAARWRDVDFFKHELRFIRRVDVYGEESSPKSIAGIRTMPLSDQLVAMLKTWRLKSQFSRMDDLIFPNRHGLYFGHDNLIKRQFLPLFDELEGVNRFNWHGLRHFAVSCWIEAGLAAKTVQTFAGHASLQVTMEKYGHLFPSDDHRKAIDQIAKWTIHVIPGKAFPEQTPLIMCHSCDMDAPGRDHTRWVIVLISLVFCGIRQKAAEFGVFAAKNAAKSLN